MDYQGPAIATTPAAMLKGPIPDAVPQKLVARIAFDRLGPPMMYEIVDNSTIGRWHYEQEIAPEAELLRSTVPNIKCVVTDGVTTRGARATCRAFAAT